MAKTHRPYDINRIKKEISNSSAINMHIFEELDSTNSWLQENGQCGDFCISEQQTKGRGRRGNDWISPANGNIYLSYCFCLADEIQHRSLLGLVTGIAIAEALQSIGLKEHGVKWPNDIFWQSKKLGGILIETTNHSQRFIIGIGLNMFLTDVETEKINQRITSVQEASFNQAISRDELLIQIIDRLSTYLENFDNMNVKKFKELWKRWDILQGEKVSFRHQGNRVTGTVADIDQHGRLGIKHADGDMQFYTSADIKLEKKLLASVIV